jgi:hypothetical protein
MCFLNRGVPNRGIFIRRGWFFGTSISLLCFSRPGRVSLIAVSPFVASSFGVAVFSATSIMALLLVKHPQ